MMASCDKKLIRSKSGYRIVASNENLTSPFLLTEPQWIPDNECKDCMKCTTKFDFMKRRHHCRRCGKCYCGTCCAEKIPLPRMSFVDPVRQCSGCLEISRKENDFFDRHLKVLQAGGNFLVSSSLTGTENVDAVPMYCCKVSTDHRYLKLECVNNNLEHESIDMLRIENVRFLTASPHEPYGHNVATGLIVKYSEGGPEGNQHTVKLEAVEGAQRRQAMIWIAGMQKAVRLLYAGRSPKPSES